MSSGRSAPELPAFPAPNALKALMAALLSGLMAVSVSASEPQPAESVGILDNMAVAHGSLEYRGVFTYEHGGVLKPVRVVQVVTNGQRWQHLLYLNGPRRELLRNDTRCGAGDVPGALATLAAGEDVSALQRYYTVHRREDDRIADRAVWTLHLMPRDGNRYGYALSIDQQTGLLLQSLLIGADNRVLERFQFVDFEVPLPAADRQQLMSSVQRRAGEGSDCPPADDQGEPGWQAQWLPPGFSRIEFAREKPAVERALYSDGLSVFSVFVDAEGGRNIPEVQAQRGATVAQVARFDVGDQTYVVSVVGEIPVETAHRIATSITIPAR